MFKKTKKDIEFLKNNIPLQYYAENCLGITEWKQIGNSLIAPKVKYAMPNANDLSSLVIDCDKNCFWRNSGKGRNPTGSIIDLIMNTSDVDVKEASEILVKFANTFLNGVIDENAEISTYKPKKGVKKEFKLPLPYKNKKRLFAYMVNFRQIEKPIYNYFIENKFMYQSIDCKCIFVSYNDEGVPIFGCVRDTNWNERITYGISGSDVNHAFYINNHSKTMIVTEAVVDAMAYMSILSLKDIDFKKYNYLALTGASKINCIKYHLEKDDSIKKILLAFDNDEAGETAYKKTVKMLKDMDWKGEIVKANAKHGKDINDELKFIKSNE